MNKDVLLFFVLFCVQLSIRGFAGVTCEHCGYEYEDESCPFEEQHLLLLNQIESYIGSPDQEGAVGTYEAANADGGSSVLAGFETGVIMFTSPMPIKPNSPTIKPSRLKNGLIPTAKLDGDFLKEQCKVYTDLANKHIPGSEAWQNYWQNAYEFAMEHSYNRYCHFFGVIALTKLKRYADALKLLAKIKKRATEQGVTSFLFDIARQEEFIYWCIRSYGYR